MKKSGLLDLNDQNLIEFTNNKFKIKEYLKDYIPILNYFYIKGSDYNFEKLSQKYGNTKFVIQAEESSGGFGTILSIKNNKDDIKLNNNCACMITKYCRM